MTNETYERIILNITQFDTEDVIITSGEEPTPQPVHHNTETGRFEQGLSVPTGF